MKPDALTKAENQFVKQKVVARKLSLDTVNRKKSFGKRKKVLDIRTQG